MTKLDGNEPKPTGRTQRRYETRDEMVEEHKREKKTPTTKNKRTTNQKYSHAKQPADKFFNSQILSNMI